MKKKLLSIHLFITIALGQQEDVITNPQQADGFGSQFQAIISSVIYAELHNLTYVYTPFHMMEHNYDNADDFIAKKEQLINFIDNFESNKNYDAYSQISYKAFVDANIAACAASESLKKIKKIFRANKNTHNYFNNQNFNIAIHIRRPNSHDNRISGANTPDNAFLYIIRRLRTIYAAKNPLFHLYSQGDSESFKAFTAHDTVLHINDPVEETFTAMVLADVLVTGASSFSYAAGLLSEGTVYYIPFWHNPLPHWISVNML
ncbi:MAG: hypothetical protein WC707_05700 [Candidatus Babeliaceae bacterium]|jgi:hypothetical protein